MPAIHCPHCQAKFTVPDSAVGKHARCSKCQQRFLVEVPLPEPELETLDNDDYGLSPLSEPASTSSAILQSIVAPAQPAALQGLPRRADGTLVAPGRSLNPESPDERQRPHRKWLLPTAIGGGVAVLALCGGLGLLAIFALGGKGGKGGVGGFLAGQPIIAPAQEGRPGDYSPVVPAPLPSADPATWKVQPDGTTLAIGLKSSFPVVSHDVQKLLFASPQSARAATLHMPKHGPWQLQWVQYDLHQTEPIATIPLLTIDGKPGNNGRFVAALNPAGDLLAVVNPRKKSEARVWSADGTQVAHIEIDPPAEVTWVGIADGNRLVALAGGRLLGFDLPAGKPAFEVPTAIAGTAQLSPGFKWLAGFTGKSFDWHNSADGSPVGSLSLPAEWFAKQFPGNPPTTGDLAFHPDGTTVAGLIARGDLYVGVWDVATGKAKEALYVPYLHTQDYLTTSAMWVGTRQLLIAGAPDAAQHLVDLDLRTRMVRYAPDLQAEQRDLGSPDGRFWRLKVLRSPANDGSPSQPGDVVLAASTIPDQHTAALMAQARQGFIWHPGMDLRVELDPSVPKNERDKTLEMLASGLAKRGYRINPDAKIAVRLGAKLSQELVQGKYVKMVGPNYAEYEVTTGAVGEAKIIVLDEQGEGVMVLPAPFGVSATNESGGEEAVWRSIRAYLERVEAPRIVFRDAAGKRFHEPKEQILGIDGVLPTPKNPEEKPPFDNFSLPSESPHQFPAEGQGKKK